MIDDRDPVREAIGLVHVVGDKHDGLTRVLEFTSKIVQ
jgi:hypothetical protein